MFTQEEAGAGGEALKWVPDGASAGLQAPPAGQERGAQGELKGKDVEKEDVKRKF